MAEHIIQFWRMQRKVRHMENRIFRIYTLTPSYTHRRCGGTYHSFGECSVKFGKWITGYSEYIDITPSYTHKRVWRNRSHSFGECCEKFVTWITGYSEYIDITPSYTHSIGGVAEHIIQFWRMQRKFRHMDNRIFRIYT